MTTGSAPVIFLHLARLYRNQCTGRLSKKRIREGLILALGKITEAQKQAR